MEASAFGIGPLRGRRRAPELPGFFKSKSEHADQVEYVPVREPLMRGGCRAHKGVVGQREWSYGASAEAGGLPGLRTKIRVIGCWWECLDFSVVDSSRNQNFPRTNCPQD